MSGNQQQQKADEEGKKKIRYAPVPRTPEFENIQDANKKIRELKPLEMKSMMCAPAVDDDSDMEVEFKCKSEPPRPPPIDDSPYEVIRKDSTPPSLDDRKADKRKNKENIPPGSQEPKDGHPQSTPKRISKSTKTKRISLTEAEDISSVKNATKKKKPQALPTHKNKLPRNKAPKSLPKNQTKMTAFFARV